MPYTKEEAREYQKKVRARRRASGICPTCKGIPQEGKVHCDSCIEYCKNKKLERIANGICIGCFKPALEGVHYCEDHQRSQLGYHKNKRDGYKSKGLCAHCGKVADSGILCSICRGVRDTSAAARLDRLANTGVCVKCGEAPQLDTMRNAAFTVRVCEKCYLKSMSQRALGKAGRWKELKDLLDKQNYRCAYSGEYLVLGENASVDHMLPKHRYPEIKHDINNVCWCTDSINFMKSRKTKEEFIMSLLPLRKKYIKLVADYTRLLTTLDKLDNMWAISKAA